MPTGSQKGEPSTALMAVSGDPGVQPAPQRSSTELQGLIDQANALQLAAHSENTLRSYQSQWVRFEAWCTLRGMSSLLPVAPEVVMLYLADWSTQDSPPAYSTITVACSGIDWAHSNAGIPPPQSLALTRLKKGLRNQLGVAPRRQAAPLRLEHLKVLGRYFLQPRRSQVRDALVVALRAAGLSYGQIVKLQLADVIELSEKVAVLQVGTGLLQAKSSKSSADLVGLVNHWILLRGGWPGALVNRVTSTDSLDHREIPPQSVRAILLRLAERAGIELTPGDPLEASVAAVLVDAALALRPAQVRDHALILALWAGGLRSDELVRLRFRDLSFDGRGMAIRIRKSKTDQEGRGATKVIPRGLQVETDPVGAMERWATLVRIAGGGDDLPVYVPIDRHDNLVIIEFDEDGAERPVSPCAPTTVTAMLRTNLEGAEVPGIDLSTFSSHSGKRGVATELAHGGADIRAIAQVTGHKSLEIARRYVEEVEAWDNNALRGLGL